MTSYTTTCDGCRKNKVICCGWNGGANHCNDCCPEHSKSRSIWKYPLVITDVQDVVMPRGAKILCVQEQYCELCVWAEVNAAPKYPTERRTLHVVGTGNPMPRLISSYERLIYLGTAQCGTFVWHVYEQPK